MNLTQAAMVIFFYLHGGVVMTQTTLTPDRLTCESMKSIITEDYMTGKVRLGNTDLKIDHVIPICIKVPDITT